MITYSLGASNGVHLLKLSDEEKKERQEEDIGISFRSHDSFRLRKGIHESFCLWRIPAKSAIR